jgi:hypothetical protein
MPREKLRSRRLVRPKLEKTLACTAAGEVLSSAENKPLAAGANCNFCWTLGDLRRFLVTGRRLVRWRVAVAALRPHDQTNFGDLL